MLTIECYSPKGMVVKGATAEQAESIRAALGASVVTGFNARMEGWVFSRKREDRIRELVKEIQGDPAGNDDLPGKWFDVVHGKADGATQKDQSAG